MLFRYTGTNAKLGPSMRDREGFSLIEMMIAMTTVTVTATLLIGALLSVFDAARLAEHRDHAASYVSSIAEELRRVPLADLARYRPAAPLDLGFGGVATIEARNAVGAAFTLPLEASATPPEWLAPVELRITLTASPPGAPAFTTTATVLRGPGPP